MVGNKIKKEHLFHPQLFNIGKSIDNGIKKGELKNKEDITMFLERYLEKYTK